MGPTRSATSRPQTAHGGGAYSRRSNSKLTFAIVSIYAPWTRSSRRREPLISDFRPQSYRRSSAACDYPRFSWCHDCELDIGESAQPAPDDDVAWRRIGGVSQIIASLGRGVPHAPEEYAEDMASPRWPRPLAETYPGSEVHQRARGHRQGERPSDRNRRRLTDQAVTNFWR